MNNEQNETLNRIELEEAMERMGQGAVSYEQIKQVYFGKTLAEQRTEIASKLLEGNVIKLNDVPFLDRTKAKKFKQSWSNFLSKHMSSEKYSAITTENNTAHNKAIIMYDVHLVHWNKSEQIKKEKYIKTRYFLKGKVGRPKKES